MIVVDASIAVKWFLVERDSDQAFAFLQRADLDLCGPDLLAVEVCRALVAAANAGRIDRAKARTAVATWLDRLERGFLPLHTTAPAMLETAVDLAIALGHPLADCIYLALADRLGCPLATADVRFRDRVGDPARVRLLGELV